ncbi:MAG: TldD/PmbA family protein [Deltaproteobacteria bacterium]|nr:TldD/PmbA family protein [Deltaproteobacteria bacterium]
MVESAAMESFRSAFSQLALGDVDFCSLRAVSSTEQQLSVRQNNVEPLKLAVDHGAMLTVIVGSGCGYAATADLSPSGLKQAFQRARAWAEATRDLCVVDHRLVDYPAATANCEISSGTGIPSTAELLEMLRETSSAIAIDPRIVDWQATLGICHERRELYTSNGGALEQRFCYLTPNIIAVANHDNETQIRSLNGGTACIQGGAKQLEAIGMISRAPEIGRQAIELLLAPQCPTGRRDLLLMPDQLALQIHESIGHPLELDRILGDERNYAGTSFVRPEMFGSYRYGSELLDVTFDPKLEGEFACYAYDDEGLTAKRSYLIRAGQLERGIGGLISQARLGAPGVACARSNGWARPAIDRIANINIEPKDASLDQLIARTEQGVLMRSNCSWSIDDSRNKFQFGCEWGQLIENGQLTTVVKNPNYRGISATFWRSLIGVGDQRTFEVMGSPYCGKGEPSQVIRVGHAAPACLFADVDIFGGDQ